MRVRVYRRLPWRSVRPVPALFVALLLLVVLAAVLAFVLFPAVRQSRWTVVLVLGLLGFAINWGLALWYVLQAQASVRHCRVCGCTDADCSQCIAASGQPCSWVEPLSVLANLCSACAFDDIFSAAAGAA